MNVKEKVEAAGFQLIDYEYVNKKVGKGLRNFDEVVIIDARAGRKYETGHISGTINIHDNQFEDHYPRLESLTGVTKSTEIIIYCGGWECVKSHVVSGLLVNEYGYENVYNYLGGLPGWKSNGYPTTKTAGTIEKEYFKTIIDNRPDNIHVIDVRAPEEFNQGHVKGAINIHVNEVYKKVCDFVINQLPKNGYVIFMCSSGGRASEIYYALQDMCGYKQMERLYYLDAHVDFSSGKCEIK